MIRAVLEATGSIEAAASSPAAQDLLASGVLTSAEVVRAAEAAPAVEVTQSVADLAPTTDPAGVVGAGAAFTADEDESVYDKGVFRMPRSSDAGYELGYSAATTRTAAAFDAVAAIEKVAVLEAAAAKRAAEPKAGRSFFRGRSIWNPLRLTGWRRFAGALVPLALACSAVFAGAPAAQAAPAPSVDSVKKQVAKLRTEAEEATEDYLETREKRKSSLVKLKAAKKDYAKQKDKVAELKKEVGLLAAETYKKGELSTLELFLSDDPESALAQSGYLPSLSDRQAGTLNSLTDAQDKLLATQKAMQTQADEAKASLAKMKKTKEKIEARLQAAEDKLDTLQAAAREEAEKEIAATTGGTASSDAGGDCSSGAAAAPSAAAKAAINYACAQLGDPYVWAAAGPNSFDCSGLTMQAYAAAGISLPHSSSLQASYGTSVSISALQPGDLVFFHSPISHVGIYLGNGMMVHAPQTGDVVKVASMWTTPSAAVRLG